MGARQHADFATIGRTVFQVAAVDALAGVETAFQRTILASTSLNTPATCSLVFRLAFAFGTKFSAITFSLRAAATASRR
jgi:hypothetical protein